MVSSRSTSRRAASSSRAPEVEIEVPAPSGGLTAILRAPLQTIVHISGVDAVAHAMDRLAKSADRAAEIMDRIAADRLDHLATAAERAAALLEQVESEIGIEGARRTLASLDRLSVVIDEMNGSLHSIEHLANELRGVAALAQRLPGMGLRRGRASAKQAEKAKA